jgi:conjugative transfer pilus assembly protein TraH
MALVNGAVSLYENYSKVSCETTANSRGLSSDGAGAKRDCQNPRKRVDINNKSNSDTRPVNINIVWKALKDRGYISFFGEETAEVFMNMTGTIIITENSSSKETFYIPSKIKDDYFRNVLLNGGDIEIFGCSDKVDCLKTVHKTIRIANAMAFKKKVEILLTSIEGKIKSEKAGYSIPLSKDEINLLNLIRIPVFKIMQTTVASAKNGGILNASFLAEVSANDILEKYTDDIMEIILNSLMQFKNKTMNVEATNEMIANIVDIRNFINKQNIKIKKDTEFILNIIFANQEFEKVLANQFSDGLGQVLQFSNQLNNR